MNVFYLSYTYRQFSLDHEQLSYQHGGWPQKLTNGRDARIVEEIISQSNFFTGINGNS